MKCPDCEAEMLEKQWITDSFFGGWLILECLFWLMLFPVVFTGIPGLILISVVCLVIVVGSWGKRWYRCPACGYATMVKK